jgi:hypothetical protein
MTNETPENKAKRAADLRKQADASEAQAMTEEDAGNGEKAIELRAQAHRQRNTAALVEPKKSTKPKARNKPE